MTVKLLAEHHLEFLSLKGGCTGSSESTLVKMPHCWKSQITTQMHAQTASYGSDRSFTLFLYFKYVFIFSYNAVYLGSEKSFLSESIYTLSFIYSPLIS